jgi:hypothetical protein
MNNYFNGTKGSVTDVRHEDVVVITTDKMLTLSQRTNIQRLVERAFASASGVLVLDGGLKIQVVRDGEVQPVIELRRRPFRARFVSHYREYRKYMTWLKAVYSAWYIARL